MKIILINKSKRSRIINIVLLSIFGLFYSIPCFSQKITITGKVIIKDSIDVQPYAVVSLHNPLNKSMLGYTVSDHLGNYKITYNGRLPNLLISVYSINIKKEFRSVVNKSQVFDFVAKEAIINIKEIAVKRKKIVVEKDTITYNVASFTTKKDVTIGEVLRRMPGIEVSEEGQISYNGKSIDNFYIEGMDLLGGRYGIANNNISASDVYTVQILNNHEPIKALKDLNKLNGKVGFNLKLKEEAKGTFMVTTVLGAGYDSSLLYDGELTGMYFGKKRQNIFTLKGNNSGNELSSELMSFSGSTGSGSTFTSIKMPAPPAISLERYLFNESYSTTANHMNKIKEDGRIRANFTYLNNKETRESFARSEYLMADSSINVITEKLSSKYKTHKVTGDVNYTLNKKRTYITNDLRTSVGWNDGSGMIISDEVIDQNLDDFIFSILNRTEMILRTKRDGGVKIISINSFNTRPHELTISPGVYPDIFNDSLPYQSLKQYARSNNISSNNSFSLLSSPKVGKFTFSPSASLAVSHQTLESHLTTIDSVGGDRGIFADAKFKNDMVFSQINGGLRLNINYRLSNLSATLGLPLNLQSTTITNAFKSDNDYRTKLYFQPNLGFRYEINSDLVLSSNYGLLNQSQSSINSLYEGYILGSYRSISSYDSEMYDRMSHGGGVKLEYKSIMNMFFSNLTANFNQYRSDVIFNQSFDGILSISEMVNSPNKGESISVQGTVSKGFIWKSLLLNIKGSWSNSSREQLRESLLVSYNSNRFSVNTKIGMTPNNILTLDYTNNWHRSQTSTSLGDDFDPMNVMTNTLTTDIYLPFDIGMTATFEHYYNSGLQSNKNFAFADIGLFYTVKKIRFSLDWTNILNTSKYITSYDGGLDTFYSEYNIRPSMVMFKVRFKIF